MRLSNTQLKNLREAVMDAFPDEEDLERMVQDQLDEVLNTIAQGKDYSSTVLKLIQWTKARGRLRELAIGASRENIDNPSLRAFISDSFDTLLDVPNLLPQELTKSLVLILKPFRNFCVIAQVFRQVLPDIQVHRPVIKDIENDKLGVDVKWLIIFDLLLHEFPEQSNGIPSIVAFVDALRHQQEVHHTAPDLFKKLVDWLSGVKQVLDQIYFQNESSPTRFISSLQGYLLITVKPLITVKSSTTSKRKFLVHGFLIAAREQDHFTHNNLIPIDDLSSTSQSGHEQQSSEISQKGAVCTFKEIQERMSDWVRRAEKYLGTQGAMLGCSYDLTVEFFLPYEHLAAEVDLWEVQTGPERARRFVPVGRKHRVVVRSADRLNDPDLLNELLRAWHSAEPLYK